MCCTRAIDVSIDMSTVVAIQRSPSKAKYYTASTPHLRCMQAAYDAACYVPCTLHFTLHVTLHACCTYTACTVHACCASPHITLDGCCVYGCMFRRVPRCIHAARTLYVTLHVARHVTLHARCTYTECYVACMLHVTLHVTLHACRIHAATCTLQLHCMLRCVHAECTPHVRMRAVCKLYVTRHARLYVSCMLQGMPGGM